MPATQDLVVDQRVHLDHDRLCRAIQDATSGETHTLAETLALAEIRACRRHIAHPLDPSAHRPPNSADRARISGLGEITLTLSPDSITDVASKPTQIRLGPDLVSVAFALSDDLHLNEFDAAVLLSDARARAAVRPDRDVVAAAKQLASARRRQSLLYLQQIVRAALLTPDKGPTSDDSFIASLMRERDRLVVDHNVFANVAQRLRPALLSNGAGPVIPITGVGVAAVAAVPPPSERLHQGEAVLLAEIIFLLAYTVQLTKEDAVLLRSLLRDADAAHDRLLKRERAAIKPSRAFGFPVEELPQEQETQPEIVSSHLVEAESVRNLLLLAWMCALDRSRYHDIYDPRTGLSGVNQLLKDVAFIPFTLDVPKLEPDDERVNTLPKCIAAAELCGAVFRLAVAEPNEQEAVMTFLRLAAYDHALSFLADSLADWIRKRAGSLSPDADLYADVLEDLSNDIAEAPHLLVPTLQFVMADVQQLAAATAYPHREISAPMTALPMPGGVSAGFGPATPGGRRARLSAGGMQAPPSPSRRLSISSVMQKGRPPRQPSGRQSLRLSMGDGGRRASEVGRPSAGYGSQPAAEEDVKPLKMSSENVLASLTRFVAQAISLAPSKLGNNSASGGLRYWTSVGSASIGFMQRMGDAVMDLWDVAMRNPYAPGGVGDAFRQALIGFLELMASTCKKQDSPLHAMAALRFLAEGGHSVISLEQLLRGLTHVNSKLGAIPSEQVAQVDEADCEVLFGIVNIVAHAAEALKAHGGIMAALGERGKELATSVGALAVHSVQSNMKEALLRCLGALGDPRPIVTFLDTVSRDKAALLRSYFQNEDAQSGNYDVTVRMLELASISTTWGDDEFPESAAESIATWFAIEEVLSHWSRRTYVRESYRWQVVHAAGTLIRDIAYRDLTGARTSRLLARLLTPAPGTGAASRALRTLVCAAGLIRAVDHNALQTTQDPHTSNLYRVSGRSTLVFAAEHGLGDAYRTMQDAVCTSSRILSLLLEANPGQLSMPRMSVVSAAELLDGELTSICAATTLIFHTDIYVPQIMRAGYSATVCAAVLAMLARASQHTENVANIFSKNPGGSDTSATEFRTSLGLIISRSDPNIFGSGCDDKGAQVNTIQSKEYPDTPLMHSALSLVESCLGRNGSSKPGLFLLGLNLDSANRYDFASYGVLGALVELVANPSNGDTRIDSMSRAEAATFLERLAANTVRSTSLAVLDHLRDVCAADSSVRGGGFADEMLFRIMGELRSFQPQNMSTSVNWNALGSLFSACLSLSALQVRVFPDNERKRCFGPARGRALSHDANDDAGSTENKPPSALDLLRVVHMTPVGASVQVVFECFRNWYLLLGARLSVHEKRDGYCSVPVLFELAHGVLESISQAGAGQNLGGVVKRDGGETAAAVVLMCLDHIRSCDNNVATKDRISSAACGTLLSGIIRAVAEVPGVGANAARARTALYTSLLVCSEITEKRVSDDSIGRALGARVAQRTGTEVVVWSACGDVVSGTNIGTKSAGLAVLCMVVRVDSVHAVMALESQNWMRKVVHACLGEGDIRRLIVEACSDDRESIQRARAARQRAAIALAEACMGLIHSVAGSGHGARVIAECGCVDSVASLLPMIGNTTVKDMEDVDVRVRGGREHTMIAADNTDMFGDVGRSVAALRKSVVCSFTGALAAAVGCAGAAIDSGAVFAIGDGRKVFVDILRNFGSGGGFEDLETVSNIAVIMSRLSDDILIGSEGGTSVGGWLASLLGSVVPAATKGRPVGATRSFLSAGVGLVEAASPREARRMGILHPEGGSLFERDVVRERALCARNMLASLRGEGRGMALFIPVVDEGGVIGENGLRGGRGQTTERFETRNGRAMGKLYEVVRVCKIMIDEATLMAEEARHMESVGSGNESGGGMHTLGEAAGYYLEEHGVDKATLSVQVATGRLKEAAMASRKHGAVCVSVFESCLLVLREFVCAAREIVRGRPVAPIARMSLGMGAGDGRGSDGLSFAASPKAERRDGCNLSVAEAERLLQDCVKNVVPLCKETEGLAETVWCGKTSSFSKQVCRQIRTASAVDASSSTIGGFP